MSAAEEYETVTIPVPLMAPFAAPLNAEAVQMVWDDYIKPNQDAGRPQSIEERALMAILRAVYKGLSDKEAAEASPE